jgi:hypothetical protein
MASRYPGEVRRITCQCLVCGRSFRRFKSQLARYGDGSFCSIECFSVARRLFNLALATGRLEPIFKELTAALREQEKAA